jgi:MFS family permease
VGGLAHHYLGPLGPGLIAVALSLANFVSAYLILPESLHQELRVKRPIVDLQHIGDAIARPTLRPLMIVWALVPLGFAGYTAALPYRAIAALGWQQLQMTMLFIIIGVTAAAVQGYFFGKLVRRTGERVLVIVGTFGMAVSIGIIPFLPNSAWLYAWTFVLAVSNSVFSPAAIGLVSVYADPNEQGTVLGAAQSISALGRTAGPPLIGTIYDVSPVTSFLLAGLFMVVAGLAAFRLAPVASHAPSLTSAPLPEPPPSES